MRIERSDIRRFMASTKGRFLAAGVWNTVFGYLITILMYILLSTRFHTISIAIFSSVVAITNSFLVYKFFVYKTRGDWILEYMKCYLVYGASGLLGAGLLWLFLDRMNLGIWMAQAAAQILTFLITYFAHKNFTFKVSA